jgi:hypothetical protein
MSPEGFEPTIPASERRQTHASDRASTGTSVINDWLVYLIKFCQTAELLGVERWGSFELK